MNFRLANSEELNDVLKLNQLFFEENICNGIVLDNLEYLSKEIVFIIEDNKKIIGYAYGHYEVADKKKTYVEKNEKGFSLEELYICKKYRNLGIGDKFYNFIENYVIMQGCNNIQVVAVSKDYNELLNFYINNLGFNFWSAWLIKKL